MPLQQFFNQLLTIERPDKLLRLADKYLQQLAEMGDSFILPKEHAFVRTPLEFFAGDLAGWLRFVKQVRDSVVPKSQAYEGLQALYRVLDIRYTQQQRRERLSAAVDEAVARGLIADIPDAKHQYARRCTQEWKLQRDALLDDARRKTKSGRVSVAEREMLLASFWAEIDEGITKGELPNP